MAFVSPNPSDFLARYPEFTAVDEDRVALVLEEAELEVGPSWIEEHRRPAIMALTAHWLAAEGALSRVSQNSGVTVSGPIKRKTVGEVSVMYADPPSESSSGGAVSASDLSSSGYGTRYLLLLRKSFPAALVV